MALAKDRDTPRKLGSEFLVVPVAADTVIYAGALVVNNAGYAAPGSEAATLVALGCAEEAVDNDGGAAGAKSVSIRRGTFKFKNSASTDLIALTELGKDVYIVDDQTVAKTSDSSARSVAGKCRGVDADGVWVEI
jgi:hypothetical protein